MSRHDQRAVTTKYVSRFTKPRDTTNYYKCKCGRWWGKNKRFQCTCGAPSKSQAAVMSPWTGPPERRPRGYRAARSQRACPDRKTNGPRRYTRDRRTNGPRRRPR